MYRHPCGSNASGFSPTPPLPPGRLKGPSLYRLRILLFVLPAVLILGHAHRSWSYGPDRYRIEHQGLPSFPIASAGDSRPGSDKKSQGLPSLIREALQATPVAEIETGREGWASLDLGVLPYQERHRLYRLINLAVFLMFIGIAVMAVVLRRRLKEKSARLEESQRLLFNQTELLRLATEATQAGAWDYRPAAQEVSMSHQWFLMLGHTPKDKKLSVSELQEYVHPDDLERVLRTIELNISKGGKESLEFEIRLRKADGSWLWVLSKSRGVEWDKEGQPSRIIGLDVNIQTFKETQAKAEQNESRFRTLFMNAPIPLINSSLDGKVLTVNDCLHRVLGYTLEDIPDLDHWWTSVYPDAVYRQWVQSTWRLAVKKAIRTEEGVDPVEFRLTCKNGKKLTMIVGASLIGDTILVSFFDITEAREKETALKESLELLKATFNATPDGILVVDNDLKMTQANRQFHKIWRIPPELESLDDDAAVRSYAHERLADPSGFQAWVDRLYHSRVQSMMELPLKDGRVLECHSAPVTMEGKETGRVWHFLDISERKRVETALKESEARFRDLFKKAPVPMGHIALDGTVLDVNESLIEMMGYAPDEVPTLAQAWDLGISDPTLRTELTAKWLSDLERAVADNAEMEPVDAR